MTHVSSTQKAEIFKAKGAEILRPHSMEDFIKDSQITQMHKTANPQNHIPFVPNSEKFAPKKLGRLHIQIRQDLLDRLLETVFKRKRDPRKRSASQRAIVEEALERYFETNEAKDELQPPVDKTTV